MQRREYIVQDEVGLHARSVSRIARLALTYPDALITVSCHDKTAPATHLTAVMAMLVRQGDTIVLTIVGGEEVTIADTIINTLKLKKV